MDIRARRDAFHAPKLHIYPKRCASAHAGTHAARAGHIKPISCASAHSGALAPRTQGRIPRARSAYKTCKLGIPARRRAPPARKEHIKPTRCASAHTWTHAPRAKCKRSLNAVRPRAKGRILRDRSAYKTYKFGWAGQASEISSGCVKGIAASQPSAGVAGGYVY